MSAEVTAEQLLDDVLNLPFPSPVAGGGVQDDHGEPEEENPFQTVNGVKTVKFYKPITVNGKELTELTLDFNSLTSIDLDNIEAAAMKSEGMNPAFLAFSTAYNLRVVARVTGINYHDLKRLNAKDANKLSLITRNFLLA